MSLEYEVAGELEIESAVPSESHENTTSATEASGSLEIASEAHAVEQTRSDVERRRDEWIARIEAERRLPQALRERLRREATQSCDFLNDAEPQLTFSRVAEIFAEAVPSLLGLDRTEPSVERHPAGDAFFQQGSWSDEAAARLAREQLERTGFAQL